MKNLALLLTAMSFVVLAAAQGTQVEFGKNRVQYHDDFDEWSQYESDNFFVYWYGKSKTTGQLAAQLAEYSFPEVQSLLEHRINEKIQIIVYSDLTDFKQSNIGSEEAFTSVAGQVKVVGNTLFVYYDGDYSHLRNDLREGIASVYLNRMLLGGNIQEVVQNAVMLNLPGWFKDGLVAYAGEAWNTSLDNELRDAMRNKRYKGFFRLAEENPRLAGHALWYYISENFGRTTVSNLLYLTRINRSVENGFLYVMGVSFPTVIAGWETYFNKRYKDDLQSRSPAEGSPLPIRNKKNYPVTQLRLSPDGRQLAYVINKFGRYRIQIRDLRNNKNQTIYRGGQRNMLQATDYNYPLLAWNPNRTELAFIHEYRDDIRYTTFNLRTRKQVTEPLEETYQRVFSMDFTDPSSLVLSGMMSGQSDLFIYSPRLRASRRLTNDPYDDRDAAFTMLPKQKGILFVSNRKDSLLATTVIDSLFPANTFDVFFLPLEGSPTELIRITRTPFANERQPVQADSSLFTYLSDRSGIYNQESGFLEEYIHHYNRNIVFRDGAEIVLHADSTWEGPDSTEIDTSYLVPVIRQRAVIFAESNLDRNINQLHTAPTSNRQAILVPRDQRFDVFVQPVQTSHLSRPKDTYYHSIRRKFSEPQEDTLQSVVPLPELPDTTLRESAPVPQPDSIFIPEGYLFQTAFGSPSYTGYHPLPTSDTTKSVLQEPAPLFTAAFPTFDPAIGQASKRALHKINVLRITPYRISFHTDQVSTQMDNTLLFQGLDNLAGNPSGFTPPPAGLLMKSSIVDLLEDYKLEGGIRIPTTLNGAEYFLVYDNKKNRLDQRIAFYNKHSRSSQQALFSVPQRQETTILLGQYGLRYPLDIFQSLRATASIRQDKLSRLATDINSLNTSPQTQQRLGLRLEYVFDNTVETALNLRHGGRIRLFGEAMKKFSLEQGEQTRLNFQNGYLGVIGADARYYLPVLKHSILATRLAGMSSFGSEKVLYYLGGVDNWLFPENSMDIATPPGTFAFQTLAANMRGFPINIRNGNSYALLNTELRVPLFKYLSHRLNSGFLRNFQAVGFFDVGTAWAGSSPFRADNPLNTTIYSEGDTGNQYVFVTLNYFRDPLVAGYGVGVRALLFGYFVRADYGWGIETRQVQPPRLYLSLGFDF